MHVSGEGWVYFPRQKPKVTSLIPFSFSAEIAAYKACLHKQKCENDGGTAIKTLQLVYFYFFRYKSTKVTHSLCRIISSSHIV